MVEGAGLENRCALRGTEGSNPSLSAVIVVNFEKQLLGMRADEGPMLGAVSSTQLLSTALPAMVLASGPSTLGPFDGFAPVQLGQAFQPAQGSTRLFESQPAAQVSFQGPEPTTQTDVASAGLGLGLALIVGGALTAAYLVTRFLKADPQPAEKTLSAAETLDKFFKLMEGKHQGEPIRMHIDSKEIGLEALRIWAACAGVMPEEEQYAITLGALQLFEMPPEYYLMANRPDKSRYYAHIARSQIQTDDVADLFPDVIDLIEINFRNANMVPAGTQIISPQGVATADVRDDRFVIRFEPRSNVKINIHEMIDRLRENYGRITPSRYHLDIYFEYASGEMIKIFDANRVA